MVRCDVESVLASPSEESADCAALIVAATCSLDAVGTGALTSMAAMAAVGTVVGSERTDIGVAFSVAD